MRVPVRNPPKILYLVIKDKVRLHKLIESFPKPALHILLYYCEKRRGGFQYPIQPGTTYHGESQIQNIGS